MTTRKEQILDQIKRDYAPLENSSRKERRKLAAMEKRAVRRRLATLGTTRIEEAISISQILENEDDEVMLQRELEVQNTLLKQIGFERSLYNYYRNFGISDQTAIAVIFPIDDEVGKIARARAETIPKAHSETRVLLRVLHSKIRQLKVSYTDKDETELINLMRSGNYSGDEIFEETLRSRRESIELMSMQIDWLRQQKEPAEIITPASEVITADSQQETPILVQENEIVESSAVEPPFSLSEWTLHFSETPWSDLPSRLHPVDSTSQQLMIAQVEELTRTYRSIKPISIVRAIAYHLEKDTLQKALATRFRFSDEEDRDWVKVKRGGDRIGLLIDEAARSAIFCIEGRDVVYRKN